MFRVGALTLLLVGMATSGRAVENQGRPVVVSDVPFLAQTVDLCGGAAAAMVLRYWGRGDVQPEDFSSLVDRAKGGIGARDLLAALASHGVDARAVNDAVKDVRREIASGRPVIALIDGGRARLHYVVIVAWANGRILFHDPSVGPFRVTNESEFNRLWKVTGQFALVVTPRAIMPQTAVLDTLPPLRTPSDCDPMVDHATGVTHGTDVELAVAELLAASAMCANDAGALRALAGVRFAQKRWADVAIFARQAIGRDAKDAESWRLLGASFYLLDDPRSALAAWNHIGEPRLDRVHIEGLVRTRQDIANAIVGLGSREVLTLESLAKAERRLDELPTSTGGNVAYRPLAGGRADVVATIGESGLIEPKLILALRLGAELAARREGRVRINSAMGRGEAIEIGGRFASRRPSVWATLDTPQPAGIPGVFSLGVLWDRQTYRTTRMPAPPAKVEERRRGAIDWSHWTTASTRLTLGLGFDRFDDRRYASIRGGVEGRAFGDRTALVADGASWAGFFGVRGFSEFGGTAAFRSRKTPRRVMFFARVDGRRTTGDAPLAVWPGAGTGADRGFLLRGSRLVTQGEVKGEVFGRGLLHGTAEAEVTVVNGGLGRLGLAVFSDWAKPWDTSLRTGAGPNAFSLGAGLRIRTLATVGLRVDVAKRTGASGVLLSAGVIPRWPR